MFECVTNSSIDELVRKLNQLGQDFNPTPTKSGFFKNDPQALTLMNLDLNKDLSPIERKLPSVCIEIKKEIVLMRKLIYIYENILPTSKKLLDKLGEILTQNEPTSKYGQLFRDKNPSAIARRLPLRIPVLNQEYMKQYDANSPQPMRSRMALAQLG